MFESIYNQISAFLNVLNWPDLFIVCALLFYAFEGLKRGVLKSFFDLLTFILSFAIGLKFYSLIASLITHFINLPHGISLVAGFFILVFLVETICQIVIVFILKLSRASSVYIPPLIDKIFGGLLGVFSGTIFIMFLLSSFIALPLSPALKKNVTNSTLAAPLLASSQKLENSIHDLFNHAAQDTLNFLTVKPESNATVHLNFSTTGVIDPITENKMLNMVNKERTSRGLSPLALDISLQILARAHAQDMLKRSYFSHYTPEGLSPFDRMKQAGINYQYAGENLAFSPDVNLAMQGLMASPGHRENILFPHFNKAGIGVLDAGIYGEMFVQEFTD